MRLPGPLVRSPGSRGCAYPWWVGAVSDTCHAYASRQRCAWQREHASHSTEPFPSPISFRLAPGTCLVGAAAERAQSARISGATEGGPGAATELEPRSTTTKFASASFGAQEDSENLDCARGRAGDGNGSAGCGVGCWAHRDRVGRGGWAGRGGEAAGGSEALAWRSAQRPPILDSQERSTARKAVRQPGGARWQRRRDRRPAGFGALPGAHGVHGHRQVPAAR
mmetsp:Transcript_39187/g.92645  ORF Transcript_39187/g.92645 Transcript_39187/m.92645 type:complete len:224 (-) Transcript_39187:3213-3884(-)